MTDLEELFRPLIDESGAHREPVEAIETRARELQGEHRRRRRAQYRFGAGLVTVVLIAGVVGIADVRHDGGPKVAIPIATTAPAPPSTPTTGITPRLVAQPSVPKGWRTYDYGLARLSIPPGWTASRDCPGDGDHVLAMLDPSQFRVLCTETGASNIRINLVPATDPEGQPFHPNARVNGIPYEREYPRCLSAACPALIVTVPALAVAISFYGSVDSRAILRTLTYSTRARVRQQPFGSAPASWRTVAFGGFTARVPSNWSTVDLSTRSMGCGYIASTVYLGSPEIVPSCFATDVAPPPVAWLQLEPVDPGMSAPKDSVGFTHNELRFVRQTAVNSLSGFDDYVVTAGRRSVEVLLGFGLDPSVAQGILGSLKLAT